MRVIPFSQFLIVPRLIRASFDAMLAIIQLLGTFDRRSVQVTAPAWGFDYAKTVIGDSIIIYPSVRVDPGRCSAESKDPIACQSRRCNRAYRRARPPSGSRGRAAEDRPVR